MNNVTLVGRLVKTPTLFTTDSGRKCSFITIAVNRNYKNIDGEYETDFLDCALWTGIAETAAEYCKTGDVIGVSGKLQSRIVENDDGTKYKKMEVVADRVSFISKTTKKDDSETQALNDELNDDDIGNLNNTTNVKQNKSNKKNK